MAGVKGRPREDNTLTWVIGILAAVLTLYVLAGFWNGSREGAVLVLSRTGPQSAPDRPVAGASRPMPGDAGSTGAPQAAQTRRGGEAVSPGDATRRVDRGVSPGAGPIDAFSSYMRDASRMSRFGIDPAVTAEGLTALVAAVRSLGVANDLDAAVQPRLALMVDFSRRLKADVDAIRDTRAMQDALEATIAALTTVQEARFPELGNQIELLDQSIDVLRVERPLDEQTESLRRFLSDTNLAIRSMGHPPQ